MERMDLLELDEDFKRKRFQSFVIIAGYLFLGGCEYAVIFPTAWDYLQTLGVTEEYWLGFTVSGYSFSAAIAGTPLWSWNGSGFRHAGGNLQNDGD
ncbi:unnamed protein product [Allacma fusca]|uniref:Uncharacterized protein n=1 Tax=Allacma fusca TaxID=39272 RepID=A0A8J2KJ14_9HEXA|nr:unnamed protein product [Allacma fusca]